MALVVEKSIEKCDCYYACGSLRSVIFLASKVAIYFDAPFLGP